MPRRRDKRTDTQNSDSYGEDPNKQRPVHFGSVQLNRMLAPDMIEGDDASKYSIRVWSNTLLAQRLLAWADRKALFQRALNCLPYSYKIWHMYLSQFVEYCSTRSLISIQYRQLNSLFERALQKLPKMPRIWLMYCQALQKQQLISKTRSVYNWSFRNLPLTQHQRIWSKFAQWAMKLDNSTTAMNVVPRYLKLNPDFKQKYAQFLKQRQFYDKSVLVLEQILKDDGYHSKLNKTKEDFFMEMIEIITTWPSKIKSVNGEEVIRRGIQIYQEQAGKLWVKLSDYFIRLGQFQKARQSLEQALNSINNAKDFGIIFNAYCKFQEEMITALADQTVRKQESVSEEDNVAEEIQRRLQKLQSLINRQPFLLLNITLRKNPFNVKAWLQLAHLHESMGDIEQCESTLEKACHQIKPEQVSEGRFSEIWIKYAKIYQQRRNINRCNEILFKATTINYKMIEDYANIWTRWAQTLIQQGYFEDALKVTKHVLFRRRIQNQSEASIKNIQQLLKSHTSLWQLYIDLEITIGKFDSIKLAYERCKQHRCLTPIMLINFTSFLWEHAYFQEAFRVFEFAVGNFKWPSLYQIWIAYITKFVSRYSQDGIGIQRTRSIFERLLKEVPKENSAIFYFMYAQFQQKYGLYSHAIQIYDRMVQQVVNQQKYQAYSIYITKVAKLLGITKTRAIFQTALQKLTQKQIIKMGLKYAQLQCDLAQVQRCRGIYTYISQFTDPRDDNFGVWDTWQGFEVKFGDKDSYKQYLRIKRSVSAKFSMLPPDLEKIEARIKEGIA